MHCSSGRKSLTWLRRTLLLLSLSVSVLVSGCAGGQRVVLVPPIHWVNGMPTDLLWTGPDVSGRVYTTIDGVRTLSENKVSIPEGWVCVPPPPEIKEK